VEKVLAVVGELVLPPPRQGEVFCAGEASQKMSGGIMPDDASHPVGLDSDSWAL
jgi:hypothetical protein